MQNKQNKGTVLKGLAFPIGYFVFMNVFQLSAQVLVMAFCFCRDILIPIASTAAAGEPLTQVLSQSLNAQELINYLTGPLMTELASTPTYVISVLTSILALVILWLVFNRKGRDFKEYFGFRSAPARAVISSFLLGFGLFFLVNAVLLLVSLVSNVLTLEWLLPTMRNLAEQLLQQGDKDLAYSLKDMADMIESTRNAPVLLPPLGVFTLAAVIFAPLIEEMVFRAGAISGMRKRLPMVATILLSSLLFSLAHVGSLNLSQLVYTFVLGIIAALLYVWSDSIYPAIICHFCFNSANLVSLTVYKLLSLDYVQTTPQGNQFFGPSYVVTPSPDTLLAWYNLFTIGFTIVTFVLSIPMLVIGFILLFGLRKRARGQDPVLQDAQECTFADQACVIPDEPDEDAPDEGNPDDRQALTPNESLPQDTENQFKEDIFA